MVERLTLNQEVKGSNPFSASTITQYPHSSDTWIAGSDIAANHSDAVTNPLQAVIGLLHFLHVLFIMVL